MSKTLFLSFTFSSGGPETYSSAFPIAFAPWRSVGRSRRKLKSEKKKKKERAMRKKNKKRERK
jgi:hypothetical protein